jgi:hypothetical protein
MIGSERRPDPEWHKLAGACGGCGKRDCHRGRCKADPCPACPMRAS